MLVGDRISLAKIQRILTHGDTQDISFQCNEESCAKMTNWSFDLRRLLIDTLPEDELVDEVDEEMFPPLFYGIPGEEVFLDPERLGDKPVEVGDDYSLYWNWLSDETIALFKDGNRLEYTTSSGEKVIWKLWTAADELKVSRSIERGLSSTDIDALRFRIVEVEGIEDHMVQTWFNRWSYGEADRFMAHINEIECGVDTDLEVQCRHCKKIQTISIPMDASFFSPATARRRSGRK